MLLQGLGPIVNPATMGLSEVQAMADAQLLDEAKIDKERIAAENRISSNIPRTDEETNKFLRESL